MATTTGADGRRLAEVQFDRTRERGGDSDARAAEYVPGMRPRAPGRNLFLASLYLLSLAVLAVTLANAAISYRPRRGC